MMKDAVVEELLDFASVAVNVTSISAVYPQIQLGSSPNEKLSVHVNSQVQLSVAVAPP